MLRKDLYAVLLKGRPVIDLLFDTEEDARRYMVNIDKRKLKKFKPVIVRMNYYPPSTPLKDLDRIRKNIRDAMGYLSDVNNKIIKLANYLGGGV